MWAVRKVQKSNLRHRDRVGQMISLLVQRVKSSSWETKHKHRHDGPRKCVVTVQGKAGQAKVWSQEVSVFYFLTLEHVERLD